MFYTRHVGYLDDARPSHQEDSLQEVKRISLLEYERSINGQATAGPSNSMNGSSREYAEQLQKELSHLENEIYDAQTRLQSLLAKKSHVTKKLQEHRKQVAAAEEDAREREPAVNYMDDFDWTPALSASMKRIFNIDSFRLCQKG